MFLFLAVPAARQHLFSADLATEKLVLGSKDLALRPLMRAFTYLGSVYLLLPITGLLVVGLRRSRHSLAPYVFPIAAGAFAVNLMAKLLVGRPRPRLTAYGFPSGHVFASVVFFGGVIYILWTCDVPRVWRWVGALVCVLLTAGVAYSRLYFNAHWLTDVVGGFAGGTAYLVVALLWARHRASHAHPDASPGI